VLRSTGFKLLLRPLLDAQNSSHGWSPASGPCADLQSRHVYFDFDFEFENLVAESGLTPLTDMTENASRSSKSRFTAMLQNTST
jgi:hypothetical protein